MVSDCVLHLIKIRRLAIPVFHPMILFFFVENCFKHGSSLDAGVPWINVYVSVDGDNLTLTTENSKPHTSVQSHKEEKEGEGYKKSN